LDYVNRILPEANFEVLIINKPCPGTGCTQNLGPIGLAVLMFIGYKRTDSDIL